MPLVTRRAKENAQVIIDHELCSLCGLCVNVCTGPLHIENDQVQVDQSILFGCYGCGQCAARYKYTRAIKRSLGGVTYYHGSRQ